MLRELLIRKNKRFQSVPDKFISNLDKLQEDALLAVIELINQLEVSGGLFVSSAENLRLASEISLLLKDTMLTDEYVDVLAQFASEFDTQALLNDEYFNTFKGFEVTPFTKEILNLSKRNAIDLMLNGLDTDYVAPLREAIENAVINNSSFSETLRNIQTVIKGNDEIEGQLMRYSKTWAHESFAVADRSYTAAVSDDLGLEWHWYSSGLIDTSRAFCKERVNTYYHKNEIEAWGNGEHTPGLKFPSGGTWQGIRRGTNSTTIFSYLGGWNCGHSVMPVSFSIVPKKDLQRAVRLGYYKPTTKVELEKIN